MNERFEGGGRGWKMFDLSIETRGGITVFWSSRGRLVDFIRYRSCVSFSRLRSCCEGDSDGSVNVNLTEQQEIIDRISSFTGYR